MSKLTWLSVFLGMSLGLAGCGGRTYPGDQRFPLEGMASFDGQPIDLGSISFVPAGGGGDEEGKGGGRACGGVIQDGKYAIPEETGPTPGTYRAEIHWLKRTGKQLLDGETGEMYDQRIEALPEKYHLKTELTVEVPAPDNKHNFDLKP